VISGDEITVISVKSNAQSPPANIDMMNHRMPGFRHSFDSVDTTRTDGTMPTDISMTAAVGEGHETILFYHLYQQLGETTMSLLRGPIVDISTVGAQI
jgi:hypothetical protein